MARIDKRFPSSFKSKQRKTREEKTVVFAGRATVLSYDELDPVETISVFFGHHSSHRKGVKHQSLKERMIGKKKHPKSILKSPSSYDGANCLSNEETNNQNSKFFAKLLSGLLELFYHSRANQCEDADNGDS